MKLLFFDPFHFQSYRGLSFQPHQPVKDHDNPILVPQHPWEKWRAFPIANCVMREGERFRMWYETAYDETTWPGDRLNCTAYAESSDGIHWERPELGQYAFEGSKANNILNLGPMGVHNASVVRDDHDPNPVRRYKMTFFGHKPKARDDLPMGINTAVSPDGIHWTLTRPPQDPAFRAWNDRPPGKVVSGDTHSLVGWIPERERYVALARNVTLVPRSLRTICYTESEDFVNWSMPVNVFAPDEKDPWGTEFYYVTVVPYAGLYLGVLCMFHNFSQRLSAARPDRAVPPAELAYQNQRLDTKLIYSRDLQVWRYADCDRKAFVPVGEAGTWDSGMLFGSSMIEVDDEVWIYYGATPMRHIVEDLEHAGRQVNGVENRMCGGLARLRRDGFVSLHAGRDWGECVTYPVMLNSDSLRVNAATTENGEIRIQMLDTETDSVLSSPLIYQGDAVDAVLPLPDKTLIGKQVRLRIEMHQADLYALTL